MAHLPVSRGLIRRRARAGAFRNVSPTGVSGSPGCDPQPVAVRVFQVTLAPSQTLFMYRDPELFRYRTDVIDVEVDQGAGRCVARVLREIKPNASPRYGHEPREPWLELMLPLLLEPEALVPLHSTTSVVHAKNRHHLLIHRADTKRPAHRGCNRSRH